MGFDGPGGNPFRIPVSDTQAYKQFGNAVVVPCVEALASYIAPWLGINRVTYRDPPKRWLPLVG